MLRVYVSFCGLVRFVRVVCVHVNAPPLRSGVWCVASCWNPCLCALWILVLMVPMYICSALVLGLCQPYKACP